MRRISLWFMLGLMLAASLVSAQDELLRNPSMDEGSFGAYTTRRGGEFPIYLPEGWNVWLAAQSGDFFNRADRTTINPHPGPGPSPVNGNRAVNIDCGYVTCTAAIYQQVSVAEGSNVQASAWAQVKACNIAPDADNCGSARESGSQTRIGIDPNGGTDPNDSDIIWSNWVQPHDQWLQMNVSATTSGTTATLFLYSTQSNTAHINRTYWDAATFQGGGEGGSVSTPVPTAPPEVPFVVPQNEQDDGSIVHRVQAGDTIDSIAVAYGLSRSDILALNPRITDPRIISLGQEIIIREPQASADETEESGAELPTTGINLEAEVTDEAGAARPEGEVTPPAGQGDNPDASTGDESREAVADATLTPAPVISVADGRVLPASDPAARTASVCVLLFNDTNQNRIREPNEALLPGGNILLSTGEGALDNQETTTEPLCFEDLAAGVYVAAARPPTNYGLTSPDQFRVQAQAGTVIEVAFGAAEGFVPAAPPPADTGDIQNEVVAPSATRTNPLNDLLEISGLVIFGLAGLVLVAGAGLTLLLRQR
jgi:LysM repeat protein